MSTYDEVMADIRAGRAKGNGALVIPKRNKYGNHRCEIEIDGKLERFDSKAERDRYLMLRILERAGAIAALERQLPSELWVQGKLIGKMRWDFAYVENGRSIVDDTKGMKATPDWMLKAKLSRALYPTVEHRINGVRMK